MDYEKQIENDAEEIINGKGYVVIPNVFTKEEIKEAKDLIASKSCFASVIISPFFTFSPQGSVTPSYAIFFVLYLCSVIGF